MQNPGFRKRMQAGDFPADGANRLPGGKLAAGGSVVSLGRGCTGRSGLLRDHGHRRRTLNCIVAATCAIAAFHTTAARGQVGSSFEQGQPNPEARTKYPIVQRVWENQSEFQNADALSEFDSYFQDYLFPSMAVSTAEGLRDLSGHRGRLTRLLDQPNYPQIHQRLTNMTFQAMKEIASGNYHPAARYNAMLVIGSLDQKAGDPRGEGDPPVPLPEAADYMLQQLQGPDVLMLGALIGLERHAQYGLPEEKRKVLADELIGVVTSERPGERTADFHAWLQLRAAQVLAQMQSLGENNRIHQALVSMMNNDTIPVVERTYVAKSLQLLKDQYTPQAGIDAAATVAALGKVLADAIEAEEEEARKFNEQQRRGGFVGQYGMLDDEPPGYPRGRLLQRINYVLEGFAAVEGALSDDLKKQVQAVREPVEELRDAALDRGVDVTLTRKIEDMADRIALAADDLGQDGSAEPADADSDLSGLEGLE